MLQAWKSPFQVHPALHDQQKEGAQGQGGLGGVTLFWQVIIRGASCCQLKVELQWQARLCAVLAV